MKRLFITTLFFCIILTLSYSQGFLGKSKDQVLKELKNDFSPKRFEDYGAIREVSGLNGTFARFQWKSPSNENLVFDAFFNKKGICIVERVYTGNLFLAKEIYQKYSEDFKYYYYENDSPSAINSHKFFKNKLSIEHTVVNIPQYNIVNYCFWFFYDTYAQDVMSFFATYYE